MKDSVDNQASFNYVSLYRLQWTTKWLLTFANGHKDSYEGLNEREEQFFFFSYDLVDGKKGNVSQSSQIHRQGVRYIYTAFPAWKVRFGPEVDRKSAEYLTNSFIKTWFSSIMTVGERLHSVPAVLY